MKSLAPILLVAFIASVAFAYRTTAKLDEATKKLAASAQNTAALSDSLRITKNKVGAVESSRLVLVTTQRELEQVNQGLSNRIARLEGDLEIAVSALASVENRDTSAAVVGRVQHSTDTVGGAWTGEAPFTYGAPLPPGNLLEVRGRAKFRADSVIVDIVGYSVALDLALAVRKRDDGLREIVATSTWPDLVIDVEGVVLEPELIYKPKRRSVLVATGIGVLVGVVGWELVR